MTDAIQSIPSDEAPARRLDGPSGRVAAVLSIALSIYALYWVLFVVQPQIYRPSFLLISLVLSFLLFPRVRGSLTSVSALDWTLSALALASLGWPLLDFNAIVDRATEPSAIDLVLGGTLIFLVLEATRRAVGWILPMTALAFIGYAIAGPWLDDVGLSLLAHRGYRSDRLIGTL